MLPTDSPIWSWCGNRFERHDSVPLTDRGFRYGMSVFESLRVENSKAQHIDAHLSRLHTACKAREFCCDPHALDQVGDTLASANMDGFARIYVTAGDGSPTAPAQEPRVFLFLESRERPVRVAYHIAIADEPHQPLFGGLKTANYWHNIDLFQQATRAGNDEALLFNERAELVSACVANVFLVHGSAVRTPSLACGARDGVIRERIIRSHPVRECSLFLEDVRSADEILLTNSWIGVMPAASIEGRKLPSRTVAASVCDIV